jgi:hypothetical protein
LCAHRCATHDEWLSDLRALAFAGGATSPPVDVPLPPGITDHGLGCIERLLRDFCTLDEAPYPPPDLIVGAGRTGRIAARLFGALVGAEFREIEEPPELLRLLEGDALASGGSILMALEPSFAPGLQFMRLQQSAARSGAGVGLLYAISLDSAIVQALKAAFRRTTGGKGRTAIFDPAAPERFSYNADSVEVLAGSGFPAEDVENLVTREAALLGIYAHGGGYCYNFDPCVLCCNDADLAVLRESAGERERHSSVLSYLCTGSGVCVRPQLPRLSIDSLKAEVLYLQTCWGIFDNLPDFPHWTTGGARILMSPSIHSYITCPGLTSTTSAQLLRFLGLVHEGLPLGQCVAALNRATRELGGDFVLFGNPNARVNTVSIPEVDGAPLNTGQPLRLPLGLCRIELTPPVERTAPELERKTSPAPYLVSSAAPVTFAPLCETPGAAMGVVALATREATISRFRTGAPGIGTNADCLEGMTREARLLEYLLHGAAADMRVAPEELEACRQLAGVRIATEGHVQRLRFAGETGFLHVKEVLQGNRLLAQWGRLQSAACRHTIDWLNARLEGRRLGRWRFEQLYRQVFRPVSRTRGEYCNACGEPLCEIETLESCWDKRILRRTGFCNPCGRRFDRPGFMASVEVRLTKVTLEGRLATARIRVLNSSTAPLAMNLVGLFHHRSPREWISSTAHEVEAHLGPGEEGVLDMAVDCPPENDNGPHGLEIMGFANGSYWLEVFKVYAGEKGALTCRYQGQE